MIVSDFHNFGFFNNVVGRYLRVRVPHKETLKVGT